MIFCSGKRWRFPLSNEKVFYPIQKFFTPLLTSWKSEKFKNLKIRFVASSAQKGGKKLSEGVKNFFMIKSNVSAFSWTKNRTFIWQTHSYSSDQTRAAKSHLGSAICGNSYLIGWLAQKILEVGSWAFFIGWLLKVGFWKLEVVFWTSEVGSWFFGFKS